MIALAAFVWFLGGLWATLRQAEEKSALLSSIVFGSGIAYLGTLTAGWQLAVFRVGDELDPQIARLAFDIGNL